MTTDLLNRLGNTTEIDEPDRGWSNWHSDCDSTVTYPSTDIGCQPLPRSNQEIPESEVEDVFQKNLPSIKNDELTSKEA